jgi:transcriptional regulator with XRE-family HTH domain
LSVRALALLTLDNTGSGVGANAVSEIENGQRRIDVDDLIALATALDVSPVALLMPRDELAEDDRGVVYVRDPEEPLDAEMVWSWLTAQAPLSDERWFERREHEEGTGDFDDVSRESWRRRFVPRFAWRRNRG